MTRRIRGPDLALLRDNMGKIPPVWCEACGAELRPHEVLLGTCPYCHEPITHVVVEPATAREVRGPPTSP